MKRFGVCAIALVFVASLWVVPAGAQEKLVLGYGGGT